MQKLITEIPIFWGAIWIVISLLISIWYYRKKDWLLELSAVVRLSLIALRFSALSLLGILLLGILYATEEERIENPLLINLIDPSSSMLNYKDSNTVKQSIVSYQQKLEESFGEKYEILNFLGSSNTDSLSFQKGESNLSNYLNEIRERYYQRNIGALIFFTDGNFNKGSNPIYTAEKFKLTPIISVGVGDTIQKTDQLIRDVRVNDIAFLNNDFPVEVNVEANKLKGKEVLLKLLKDGNILSSKRIVYSDNENAAEKVVFNLSADKLGVQSYSLSLEVLEEEYNIENNLYNFYVEVIDGRNKVLLTSASPHPDLGAIKLALSNNENLEVDAVILDKLSEELNNYDLIVLHDPGSINDDAMLQQILNLDKPVLFILGSSTNDALMKKLPLGIQSRFLGSELDEVQALANPNFKSFELGSDLVTAIKNYPPLSVRFGRMELNNTGQIALYQALGDINTNKPLLYFIEQNNTKYGAVFGEGIWRWRIADYAENQNTNNFNTLIDKLTQYLVLKKDASNLRLKLPRKTNNLEDVRISAEFYNDNLEKVNDATVEFELINGKDISVFDFANNNGEYQLNLGKLKAGKYSWVAKTNYNGRKYEKKGVFVISAVLKEDLDLKANHNLLKQISSQSNGAFYELNNIDALLSDLAKRKDIVPLKYETLRYKDLIDFLILFIVITALLSLEWFLRRYNGAY